MNFASDLAGWIRTTVQAFAAGILGYGPVAQLLDQLGFTDVTPAQVAMIVTPILMSLYWRAGSMLQKADFVSGNVALRWLVTALMGGPKTPSYAE